MLEDEQLNSMKASFQDAVPNLFRAIQPDVGFTKMVFGAHGNRGHFFSGRHVRVLLKKTPFKSSKPPYSISSNSSASEKTIKGIKYAIVCEIICFIASKKDVTLEDFNIPSSTSFYGATCQVLLRRLPLELYGGTYIVPAGAIDITATFSELQKAIDSEWDRAPHRLEVAFSNIEPHPMSLKPLRAGADPPEYEVRADATLPPVLVKPRNYESELSEGSLAVVNWTDDKRLDGQSERYNKLIIRQEILRNGEPIAAEPVDHKDGKVTDGFLFNWGARNALKLPMPGEYVLRYTLRPFRNPYLRSFTGSGSKSPTQQSLRIGRIPPQMEPTQMEMGSICGEIKLTVRPSLPIAFDVEPSSDVLRLGEKVTFKVRRCALAWLVPWPSCILYSARVAGAFQGP